jgi:hypothetical protein
MFPLTAVSLGLCISTVPMMVEVRDEPVGSEDIPENPSKLNPVRDAWRTISDVLS